MEATMGRRIDQTARRSYEPTIQEAPPLQQRPIDRQDPSYQAYQILHFGFTAAPLIAGSDKFFHLLANWDQYLTPLIPRITGISAHKFMLIAGAIEIVAGIGVALKPRIFGYVVSAWLLGIVINLLVLGNFYDIALRDFGLSLGALALARSAKKFSS
jgi:hypothetical protein